MINGLSLFANVGIAETYLHQVGVDIVVANELLPERARFYQDLYPECNMICGDITNAITYNEVIEESRRNNVDFIIATPPCQGMSIAGQMDPEDPRNYLITYAVEAIRDLGPSYVFMENVFMQLQTYINYDGERVLIPDFVDAVLGDDYYIEKKVIDTKFLGVPQQRKRAIMLLSRKDNGVHWTFPENDTNIITLEQAIGDLPSLDPLVKEVQYRDFFPDYEIKRQRGLEVSRWHCPRPHVWRNVECMLHTPTGCSARQNPVYFPKKKDGTMVGGAPRTYMRMDWDKAAPTITSYNHTISSFQNVHPGRLIEDTGLYSDPRVLTIFEMIRVMSLPDNWNIPEWASTQLIRQVIGEGVPPEAVRRIVEVLNIDR
nr:DNA cytosine methyltransferase [uncultured Mediterraneibacter sp.]